MIELNIRLHERYLNTWMQFMIALSIIEIAIIRYLSDCIKYQIQQLTLESLDSVDIHQKSLESQRLIFEQL